MLTLAQIQNSTVANVAGVDPTSPQFTAYVNDAVEQLVNLGEWWATVQQMTGFVIGGKMTWPAGIDTVLAMKICGREADVTNFWYDYTPIDGWFRERFLNDAEWFAGWPHHRHSVVEFSGTQAMFAGPSSFNPFAVQVTADNPADYGKLVTIYGYDTNGQEVTGLRPDGTTQRGIQMTLAAIAPNTGIVMSDVSVVTKDITVGIVRAWQFFPVTGQGLLAGLFAGAQTTPRFLWSHIKGCAPECCYRISALVKIGFQPVAYPSDIATIGNLQAIKSQVQSIKSREKGDDMEADKYETTAIRRLNMELETRFPLNQIILQNHTFNGGQPHRRLY